MSGPMKATTVAVFLFLAPFAQGQTTVSRDPQAVSLLTQSVNAAFGSTGLSTYRDFTATGTITYFWAGDQVLGSATVKGRGPAEFRIDASLPMGTRSYAVNYGVGALKDTDGTLKPIPFHNTVNGHGRNDHRQRAGGLPGARAADFFFNPGPRQHSCQALRD